MASRTLADLPEEIQRVVASNLDRPSAVDLSVTCSALKEAAESEVWRKLIISLRTGYETSNPDEWPRPLGGVRLLTICYFSNQPSGSLDIIPVTRFYNDLVNELTQNPSRCQQVRSLLVDLNYLVVACGRLLGMIRLSLQELEIARSVYGNREWELRNRTISRLFNSLDGPLISLRTLRIPLHEDWSSTLLCVFPRVPFLRSLHIEVVDGWCGGWGNKFIFNPAPAETVYTPLPSLRRLVIEEMSDALVPMVMTLINGAPRLKSVELGDPTDQWHDESVVEVVKQLPDLEHLGLPKKYYRKLAQPLNRGFTLIMMIDDADHVDGRENTEDA